MQGTIHRDLFKDHETDLLAGTVLVLKQVIRVCFALKCILYLHLENPVHKPLVFVKTIV